MIRSILLPAAALLCGLALNAAPVAAAEKATGEFTPSIALAVPNNAAAQRDYVLGPFDKVSIHVFGQDKLSLKGVQIDAGGQFLMPLIGPVQASGKTSVQLSQELAGLLGERFLQSPSVSVSIDEAVSQRVTVSGAVIDSGVFSLRGRTTLMQALSLAKGPDPKLANLRQIAVFREIDGRPARAVFDLKAIRAGQAIDPEIFGGDSIIVSGSGSKQAWRELIQVLPSVGAFAYF